MFTITDAFFFTNLLLNILGVLLKYVANTVLKDYNNFQSLQSECVIFIITEITVKKKMLLLTLGMEGPQILT